MEKTESSNAYYFTYSLEGHPYKGGWTTVYARSRAEAIAVFNLYHPPVTDNRVNCAEIYDDAEFHDTELPIKGNFGRNAREVIAVYRTIYR